MAPELLISAPLTLRSALHVGGTGGDEVADDSIRRDASGRPFVPGSALVGPLRALATRLAPRILPYTRYCAALTDRRHVCGCPVCQLFGEVNPEAEADENQLGGRASALWCADVMLTGATQVRDGVAIERANRAARATLKYTTELLMATAPGELQLTLRSTGSESTDVQNRRLLALLLHEWQQGRGTLGGRVGRGLGAFSLGPPVWRLRDLREPANLMAFLRREDDDYSAGTSVLSDEQVTQLKAIVASPILPAPAGDRLRDWPAYAVARAWAELELILSFSGPLLVSDPGSATWSGFDHAPLGATLAGPAVWVLPGSGLRGVLRSQAERIARTLATRAAADRGEFLLRCPAGDPTNIRSAEQPLATSDALLRVREAAQAEHRQREDEAVDERTAPAHHDLADRLFGGVRLGSRLMIADAPLLGEARLKALDFLAIDRFTGGGRDSAKFDAVALWSPCFAARLRIENPQPWELGWLLLTLRDLHDGLTGVGFGRSKGFGRAQIVSWKLRLGYLDAADRAALASTLPDGVAPTRDGVWSVLAATQSDAGLWRTVASNWVRAFNAEVTAFRRGNDSAPPLQSDSYFGVVEALYPRIVEVGND